MELTRLIHQEATASSCRALQFHLRRNWLHRLRLESDMVVGELGEVGEGMVHRRSRCKRRMLGVREVMESRLARQEAHRQVRQR